MENPIKVIRKEKELTAKQMAMMMQVSPMAISRLEQGITLNIQPNILDTLEKWGYDRKKVVADYKAWVEKEIQKLEEKIR